MSEEVSKKSILEKFQMNSTDAIVWTLLYTIVGIIPVMGAIRGPISGFLTGYLGTVLFDLLIYNAVVTMTIPAIGYGLLGFIAGLATYDLSNGRSLIKLTILSVVGFVFTLLIIVAAGLVVESYATLVVLGFVMLPLVTSGLPTVILLTPVYARIYHLLMYSVVPRIRPE